MNAFEYASPSTKQDAVRLLAERLPTSRMPNKPRLWRMRNRPA